MTKPQFFTDHQSKDVTPKQRCSLKALDRIVLSHRLHYIVSDQIFLLHKTKDSLIMSTSQNNKSLLTAT